MTAQRKVYFCFADPVGFSGQKAATEIAIKGLTVRGWECVRHPQPVLDRGQGGIAPVLRYAVSLLAAWVRALVLLGGRGSWLNVNLGQTRIAFMRDIVPLLLGRLGLGRAQVVISLHGSPFMRWADESLDVRVFRFLLNQAGVVTVLGERQRARLIALGVSAARVVVLVNTCVLEGILKPETRDLKHKAGERVRLLHLSSLIDTKGYVDYLEALVLLASRPGVAIEAVLCGKVTMSEFAERFHDVESAEVWIESTIAAINRSERVTVRWVRGAVGVDKTQLFQAADIFVLPTRYAVEAQPLVLLEAMSAKCAILTTRAGEIETILDEQSARFLEIVSAQSVSEELAVLINDPVLRQKIAKVARARFETCYALDRHMDAWEALLSSTDPKS